jgi:Fis family transcriptional regulator, factor for inversion stimulation protein
MGAKSSKGASKKQRAPKTTTDRIAVRNKPLSALTEEALNGFFSTLNGHHPGDLHTLVMGQVERPLLAKVMSYTNGNQSVAAEILGLNRGTLRKKLHAYDLLPK